ncbi:Uncharacterized protein DBV15_03623, partial [Temnothorax longispinosus]
SRRIANPDVTIALIPRHLPSPGPCPPSFSQSSGFLRATTKRNISTGRVLPATNLRRSNNSAPFVRLSIRTTIPSVPPRSVFPRHTSVVPRSFTRSTAAVAGIGDGDEETGRKRRRSIAESRHSPFASSFTSLSHPVFSIDICPDKTESPLCQRVAATLVV